MRDSEIKAMIRALRRIEREESLNLRGLVRRLGYSAGQLSMVFAGKRRPGMRFVRAVVERFPEIRRLLAASLSKPQEEESKGQGQRSSTPGVRGPQGKVRDTRRP